MKLKMYVIHDSAVKAFNTPFCARTHGEAERNFRAQVNKPENGHLFNSPEHFTLFHIGEYDEQNAEATTHAPMAVITGIAVKESLTDNERQLRMAGT